MGGSFYCHAAAEWTRRFSLKKSSEESFAPRAVRRFQLNDVILDLPDLHGLDHGAEREPFSSHDLGHCFPG